MRGSCPSPCSADGNGPPDSSITLTGKAARRATFAAISHGFGRSPTWTRGRPVRQGEWRPTWSPSQPRPDIFDAKKVTKLIELMKEHDLSGDRPQAGRHGRAAQAGRRGGGVLRPGSAAPAGRRGSAADRAPAAKESAADARMLVIKSPMVGTFYRASGPDSAPFVKVGDRIGPEKTVCIVEAMKVFNEIPAGVSGRWWRSSSNGTGRVRTATHQGRSRRLVSGGKSHPCPSSTWADRPKS